MNPKDNFAKCPKVSFIIPCYDIPAWMVKECIDSIMALSLRPEEREIIVVDDGSDNYLIDELTEHRDHIIYIRTRKSGLGAARNNGLQMATGAYIQFVDGYDKLISEAYEHCLDIVRYNDPDIVLFDFAETERKEDKYYIPEPQDGAEYMRHNDLHVTAWGYVFKKSILLSLRFTPGLLHEDEEFTPQLMLRAEKVYDTNIAAYFYRKRPKSSTQSIDKRSVIKRLNDVEHIIFHLDDIANSLPTCDSAALKRRVAQLTMDYIFNTIRLTHSKSQLEQRINRLKARGLFPLPENGYTKKYTLLSKLVKYGITRKLLASVIR